jgi:putative oxidoreductase
MRNEENIIKRKPALVSHILIQAAKLSWVAALATRLVVGWVFIESGWGKLQHLPKVVDFFRSLGIPAPNIQAPMVACIELICGCLLICGLLARIAAIPLIGVMVVAIATAKSADIGTASDLFAVSEFLYILLLGWIIIYGPGSISIDRFR